MMNLMFKGTDEIDGFHNSNHLYRGPDAEKNKTNYSRSPGRSMSRHKMSNLVAIEGFNNET